MQTFPVFLKIYIQLLQLHNVSINFIDFSPQIKIRLLTLTKIPRKLLMTALYYNKLYIIIYGNISKQKLVPTPLSFKHIPQAASDPSILIE